MFLNQVIHHRLGSIKLIKYEVVDYLTVIAHLEFDGYPFRIINKVVTMEWCSAPRNYGQFYSNLKNAYWHDCDEYPILSSGLDEYDHLPEIEERLYKFLDHFNKIEADILARKEDRPMFLALAGIASSEGLKKAYSEAITIEKFEFEEMVDNINLPWRVERSAWREVPEDGFNHAKFIRLKYDFQIKLNNKITNFKLFGSFHEVTSYSYYGKSDSFEVSFDTEDYPLYDDSIGFNLFNKIAHHNLNWLPDVKKKIEEDLLKAFNGEKVTK